MYTEHPREGHSWHAIAALHGHRIWLAVNLRNGLPTAAWITADRDAPVEDETGDDDTDVAISSRGITGRTLLRILQSLDEYAASGRFTEVELHTMRKLLFEGWSLRRLALHDGVSPAAVRARIEGSHGHGGLKKKAERFYRWWSEIHKRRKRD
jgi:hypothetical protein